MTYCDFRNVFLGLYTWTFMMRINRFTKHSQKSLASLYLIWCLQMHQYFLLYNEEKPIYSPNTSILEYKSIKKLQTISYNQSLFLKTCLLVLVFGCSSKVTTMHHQTCFNQCTSMKNLFANMHTSFKKMTFHYSHTLQNATKAT